MAKILLLSNTRLLINIKNEKIITFTILLLTLFACNNNSAKKLDVKIDKQEKLNVEEKNSEIEKLKAKYKHLRAKFVSTDEGDLFYYNFKDEKGKDYSF